MASCHYTVALFAGADVTIPDGPAAKSPAAIWQLQHPQRQRGALPGAPCLPAGVYKCLRSRTPGATSPQSGVSLDQWPMDRSSASTLVPPCCNMQCGRCDHAVAHVRVGGTSPAAQSCHRSPWRPSPRSTSASGCNVLIVCCQSCTLQVSSHQGPLSSAQPLLPQQPQGLDSMGAASLLQVGQLPTHASGLLGSRLSLCQTCSLDRPLPAQAQTMKRLIAFLSMLHCFDSFLHRACKKRCCTVFLHHRGVVCCRACPALRSRATWRPMRPAPALIAPLGMPLARLQMPSDWPGLLVVLTAVCCWACSWARRCSELQVRMQLLLKAAVHEADCTKHGHIQF